MTNFYLGNKNEKGRYMAKWYIKSNNVEHGPISSAELKEMGLSGQLQSDHQVRKDGSDDWRAASTFKGLVSQSQRELPIDVQAIGEKAEEINQKLWFLDLKFEHFFTPRLIGLVFMTYVIVSCLGYIAFVLYGVWNEPLVTVIVGSIVMLIFWVASIVYVRVILETFLVFFKIAEHLSFLRYLKNDANG